MTLRRVALGVSLAAATAAAGCFACANPVREATVTIPLEVRVHEKTELSRPGADAIASRSSKILQTKDSPTDRECQVQLQVDSLDGFNRGDGIINSKYDFDLLFMDEPLTAAPATSDLVPSRVRKVRVVAEIYWCRGRIGSAAGCADIGGTRIAVARRSPDREGELWAHEVGHTKGLSHRSVWVAVMHPSILPDHTEVTSSECTAYRW